MNFETIKQLSNQQILTLDEVKIVLDYIVNNIKSKLDINNFSTKFSKESSMRICELCNKLNIAYVPFNLGTLGMSEMEHNFGITGFQTEYGPICFLLDLTYIQFTDKTYPVNIEAKKTTKMVPAPGNYISKENKNQLLESRYLTLTQDNFDDYIGSFIEAYRLANPIDERQIYDDAYTLLEQYGINLVEKDYLKNGGRIY